MQSRRDSALNLTKFDEQMEYILDSALSSYELERLTGQTFGNEEFSEAIKNIVPDGHTFKAFPI